VFKEGSMAKRKIRRFTAEKRKKLGLKKMPDTMYEPYRNDLETPAMEERPIDFGETRNADTTEPRI
jgi:hypothetical protein